jgi:hypothetical protein
MNRLQAISKRLVSSTISKRIIAASVKLGIFIFLFAASNAASALEAIAKLFGKAVEDTSGASDAISKATTKPASDAAAGSDAQALTVGKAIDDQLFSTDDINGAGADDDQNISFFKVLSHPSFAVESIALLAAYLRSFADTGQAADSAVLLAGKNSEDIAGASDADAKLTGLGKSDTISSTDAGYALNQDYVDDAFYFADDYVGTKRTF